MQNIHSLVQCLTSREWESFQNYLTCFSTHANDEGGPKQLQLARILREAKECPEHNRCCLLIYGVKDDLCFDKLKSRLKDKILDFLLTDISCDKKEELDEADFAIIKMKKMSAQFQQLFYSKTRIPLLRFLLEEIINLAKEYEHYSLLVDHLRIKKGFFSWKNGEKEFREISKQMDEFTESGILVNKAEHLYFELVMMYEQQGKPDTKKILLFLDKKIAEVSEWYEKTKSSLIHYRLKALQLDYYLFQKNYTKARSVCLEWLDIVRNNKSVYRRQRIGVVYDHLSRCEYYLKHYKQAIRDAREAQKHFNLNSENYCIALEQEFYAWFAMEKYGQAAAVAEKMLSSATRKELGEFRHAKYNYLLANALFKLRRFSEALNILSQERAIAEDKAGWETGARTLTIMTLCEMLKLDEAAMAVTSLKRFMIRTEKETTVSPRDKKILNLLLIAERAGFAFTLLNGNTDKYMELLCSKSEEYKWEPFTHELIPFHQWYLQKMGKGRSYVPSKKEKVKVKVK